MSSAAPNGRSVDPTALDPTALDPTALDPTALDPTAQYCYFFDDDQFDETDRPGFRRRVIVGDHLELWFWRIKGGAEGSFLHNHDANEQLGIIMRGTLDFRIGGSDDHTRNVLHAGDLYLAPPTVWHGDSIFVGDDDYDEVWILDVFAPPRTPRAENTP